MEVVAAEAASEAAKVNSNTVNLANPVNPARKASVNDSAARTANAKDTTTMRTVKDSVARNAPRRQPLPGSLHRQLRRHRSQHQ